MSDTNQNVLPVTSDIEIEVYPDQVEKTDESYIPWELNKTLRIAVEQNLKIWNIACSILHFIQGLIIVLLGSYTNSSKFKLPLTTLFLNWENQMPKQALVIQGYIKFAVIASLFSFISGAAHLIIVIFFKTYITDLRKGLNRFRWFEYTISSSIMIALIAMLFGMYDIISLVLIMSVNACMNLFGYVMESQNQTTKKVDWSSFWFGCFAGVVPWVCIFTYLGAAGNISQVPGFVWGILVAYLIMFNTFPVNMVLQYLKVGRWSDAPWDFRMGGYYFGEKVYQILSLAAKSLLVWLVYGGTNQPNPYIA